MRSGSTGADEGVRATGKRTAVVAGLLTLLVAGALVVALRQTVYEWWLLRRLESGEADETTFKTLGELGSVRAIPRLLEIAANSLREIRQPSSFAPAADQALRDVIARSGTRASGALLEGLESPSPKIRAHALRLLARSAIEPGLFAERAVLALNDPERKVRQTACGEVKRLGVDAVVALWRALEKHGFELNFEVESALGALGRNGSALTPVLIGRFEAEPDNAQAELIDLLGSFGEGSLVVARLLGEALANEEEAGASRASLALQQRFPAGRHALGVLREALTGATPKTRRRAVETLGLFDDARQVAPDLLARLRDQEPEVRVAAALSLGSVGASDDEVVAALTVALQDPVEDVRWSALSFFLRLHQGISIPVSEIEARLSDSSASVRRQAAKLLLKACGADPLVLPACIEGLGKASDPWRREAAMMIADMGPVARDAAPYLAGHVHDPDSSRTVLKALLALGPGGAVAAPALLEALDTDDAERFGLASEALACAAPESVQFLNILREAIHSPEPPIRPLAGAALWRLCEVRVEARAILAGELRGYWSDLGDAAVSELVSLGHEMLSHPLAAVLDPPRAAVAPGRTEEVLLIMPVDFPTQDSSSEEGDLALEALIALEADPTGPLLEALQSSDPRRRSFAIQIIKVQDLRNADFGRPLEGILSDKDSEDRASAAILLLQIDPLHESAGRVLAATVADAGGATSFDGDPLGGNSRELTALASSSPAAVEALLAFYRRSNTSPVDGYRLQPGSGGQAPFVAPLTAALANNDEPTRHIAACLLRDSGPAGAPAVPALIACLEDASARVRVRAALTLGTIDPAAAPLATGALMRQLAQRQDPLMLATALGALGDLGAGARDALPTLLAIVGDAAEEATLRCLALEAAVCIGGEGAIEPELRVLVDRGPGVLRRYAELLRVGVGQ